MITTDLDPKFTFDSFVVGPENRLASAAARRVADAPGTSYNPLFIYSSSGMGKSHILHGIAHYTARVHPEYRVAYVAVESFLDELTQALRGGTEEDLRTRYEELQILLLDDVQFLRGQKEAQEMLLRLLDEMSKSEGQVVLASDRPPSEIDAMDARLLTRFSGGLLVDIGLPKYETRVAILIRRAAERGQTFESGVAEAIAKYDFKNVRELTGGLNKVLAVQELEDRQVQVAEVGDLVVVLEAQAAPPEGPIAGQQLLDEFGSFREDLSHTVATKAEREEAPWRRLLRDTAETFEKDGFLGTRLRRLLELDDSPPEPQKITDEYRRDVARLREVSKSLDAVGNPWPEAAIGLLKDPERLAEAESLLASATELVKPFPVMGEGPLLSDLRQSFEAVVVRAAERLVTEERPEYNPLYIWSGNREGPLAVLAATARSFREEQPMAKVAIISAGEFAEDYIRALSQAVAGAWRERWWGVDLLLIYDAELISDAERAKDEFFHLFEGSKGKGTKILITAGCPPSGIANIDERLRSRFEMGLVVEAGGRNLPPGAGELNLGEALPEFIQDEDLWSGFMRPTADAVTPAVDEFEVEDHAGKMVDPEPEVAVSTATAATGDGHQVEAVSSVSSTTPAWRPSRENAVWDWAAIEDRIVEVEQEA